MEAGGVDPPARERVTMPLHQVGSRVPRVEPGVFVAEGAQIVGDVQIARDASVWYNAVLRGDINRVTVGERTNIQDAAVVHVTEELPALIGRDVTVGHGAIVHACTVGDGCLIGMGSVVLDGAVIGAGSLVAAGAVVLQSVHVPEGSLVAGIPGRVIRSLSPEEREQLLESARQYVRYARSVQGP